MGLGRYAPAGGRLWSVRSASPRDANHFTLITVAPWPPLTATGWGWGPVQSVPIAGPSFMLQSAVGWTDIPPVPPAEWHAAGVTVVRTQVIIAVFQPPAPSASPTSVALTTVSPGPHRSWTITVPYAWPAAVLALPPLAWLGRAYVTRGRRRRRADVGR